MKVMSKNEKEANEYKNSSTFKIKFVLILYKFLSFSGRDNVNFFYSFFGLSISFLLFTKPTIFTTSLFIAIHYFFFWKYIILKKRYKLVSDNDKEEIDEIITILNGFIKERENKKPH